MAANIPFIPAYRRPFVPPTPSFLDQLVPQITGWLGREDQRRAQGLQERQTGLQVQRLQTEQQERDRQQASRQTLNDLAKSALNPDGSIDELKLQQGLTEAGLFDKWPDIQKDLIAAKEARAKYNDVLARQDADESETLAAIGALARAAGNDPTVATQGIQDAFRGRDPSPRVQRIREQLQAAPTPDTVEKIFNPIVSTSKGQTDLAARRQQTAASVELTEDRDTTQKQKEADRKLGDYSRQLWNAGNADKTGKRYAEVYATIPEDLQDRFDPPEAFTPGESPLRALENDPAIKPDQILMRRRQVEQDKAKATRDEALDASLIAAREDIARHRRVLEAKAPKTAADPEYKKDRDSYNDMLDQAERAYKSTVDAWKAAHPYPTPDAQGNYPQPPAFPSLPDFDTWRAPRRGAAAPPPNRGSAPSAGGSNPAPPSGRVPAGLVPGARVRLKNGQTVTVKTVNPDGSFTY